MDSNITFFTLPLLVRHSNISYFSLTVFQAVSEQMFNESILFLNQMVFDE